MSNLADADFKYPGSELDLFAHVVNWKAYWSSHIQRFVGNEVLEAGAGIGSNTPFLDSPQSGRPLQDFSRWVCLEPDPRLLARLVANLGNHLGERRCEAFCGTLATFDSSRQFDTVIYIDVLEHIDDDRGELQRAASHLKCGGRIIVLAPAHQWLFTPFDQAVGHFRRYNRSMLRNISPRGLRIEQVDYLDSAGLAASIANRLFLRQSMPTRAQLRFWDRWLIPVSRVTDKLLGHSMGKSIIAVWRKP